MGSPSFALETSLELLRVLLYCMAYIFAGAAVVALSVYIILVCSEIISAPRSKKQRANFQQSAGRAEVAEETLEPFAAEVPTLALREGLPKEMLRVSACPHREQKPTTAPDHLETEPIWP